MAFTLARPWRRGSLPVGITGVVVLIILIIAGSLFRPALFSDPVVLAAAKAVVAAGIGYLTMRVLRSRKRLRWHLAG
ncbi:hypothetical protein AB0I39_28030 [Kitasatospora purpeofusca]|uniref:hypothetical protein n=1 Tax=Kitasatospora purpeofusca TaxID=67352 RepID=UPI0033CFD170